MYEHQLNQSRLISISLIVYLNFGAAKAILSHCPHKVFNNLLLSPAITYARFVKYCTIIYPLSIISSFKTRHLLCKSLAQLQPELITILHCFLFFYLTQKSPNSKNFTRPPSLKITCAVATRFFSLLNHSVGHHIQTISPLFHRISLIFNAFKTHIATKTTLFLQFPRYLLVDHLTRKMFKLELQKLNHMHSPPFLKIACTGAKPAHRQSPRS